MLLAVSTIAMLSYVSTSLQTIEEQVEETYLPWFIHNEKTTNLNKCIVSGTIINVEIELSTHPCDDDRIKTFINGENGLFYEVVLRREPKEFEICDGGIHTTNRITPKVGTKIDYLIDNIFYVVLSTEKNGEGEYKLIDWNTIITGNFTPCEPNIPKEKELEIRKKGLNSYLPKLYAEKPRTAKKLQTALENLDLSILPQETNILVLYAREILKMLIESL